MFIITPTTPRKVKIISRTLDLVPRSALRLNSKEAGKVFQKGWRISRSLRSKFPTCAGTGFARS
jgi:hypothetical protein